MGKGAMCGSLGKGMAEMIQDHSRNNKEGP